MLTFILDQFSYIPIISGNTDPSIEDIVDAIGVIIDRKDASSNIVPNVEGIKFLHSLRKKKINLCKMNI
jgi:hypothetical protein